METGGAAAVEPPRRTRWRIVQLALAAVIVAFVVRKLVKEWGAVRLALDSARPDWLALAASAVLVLATYALLIETWRVMLRGFQHNIPFVDAARIWTFSNLGKYLPGKVWAITALVVMTREFGVPASEGATVSVLLTLINTIVGFVVAIAAGSELLQLPSFVAWVVAALAIAVLATPAVLPRAGALAGKLFQREIVLRPLKHRAVLLAALFTAVAWVMYGVAFQLFARGVLGGAPGALRDYVAIFAGSYLLGFVFIFAPAGLGVREGVMATALQRAGFAIGPAYLLVAASRLWLTALEIVPPLFFLAFLRRRQSPAHAEEPRPTR